MYRPAGRVSGMNVYCLDAALIRVIFRLMMVDPDGTLRGMRPRPCTEFDDTGALVVRVTADAVERATAAVVVRIDADVVDWPTVDAVLLVAADVVLLVDPTKEDGLLVEAVVDEAGGMD